MPSDGDWIYSLSIRRSSVLTSAPLPHYNHKISEKRLAWVIWKRQFQRWKSTVSSGYSRRERNSMLSISKYSHLEQREVLETHYDKIWGWQDNFMRIHTNIYSDYIYWERYFSYLRIHFSCKLNTNKSSMNISQSLVFAFLTIFFRSWSLANNSKWKKCHMGRAEMWNVSCRLINLITFKL